MADKFFKFCECVCLVAFALICMSVAIWAFDWIVVKGVLNMNDDLSTRRLVQNQVTA